MKDNRKEALANYLGMEKPENDLIKKDISQENVYTVGRSEYLVLTDEEADERAREYIEHSLWAFNADFILRHNLNCSSMDNWEYDAAITSIKEAQSRQAENLNGLVRCLITDIDEFIEDAICEDGRGHFLASYDGFENEETVDGITYYIYQLN